MIAILLGTGFEETEAIAPYDLLKRAGCEVRFVTVGENPVVGSHGIPVTAELNISQLKAEDLEMVVLPGGLRGVQSLQDSSEAMELTKQVWANGDYVAAICAAPTILAKLGITNDKQATCYPGMEDQMGSAKMQAAPVVTDGKLVTGRAAGSAIDFGLALITALKDEQTAKKIASGIVYG